MIRYFERQSELDRLLSQTEKQLGGRNLKVNEARPEDERPARSNCGGGRGRSGFSHEDYRESPRANHVNRAGKPTARNGGRIIPEP